MRKDHPSAGSDLDLESFLSLSHLLVSPENERFGVVDVALTKMGLKRRLVLTLPHMYAAPALIASSDMIATIMEGVVSASGHAGYLAVLKLSPQLEPVQFMVSCTRRTDPTNGKGS